MHNQPFFLRGVIALSFCVAAVPAVQAGNEPVWHLYVIRTPARDALQAALKARGVASLVHYPTACHRQRAYAGTAWPALPAAEAWAREVLSLPIGPHLALDDAERIAAAVRGALQDIGQPARTLAAA